MVALPPVTVMAPGAAGNEPVAATTNVRAVLVPQPFEAVTEIFPANVPAVTLMVFVVEEPVQPDGNVHV